MTTLDITLGTAFTVPGKQYVAAILGGGGTGTVSVIAGGTTFAVQGPDGSPVAPTLGAAVALTLDPAIMAPYAGMQHLIAGTGTATVILHNLL